jgi:hypothetical protein
MAVMYQPNSTSIFRSKGGYYRTMLMGSQLVIAVVCAVMVLGLTSCATQTEIPDSVLEPPIYPNAQNTNTTVEADGDKKITFTTNASLDEVYQYYKDTLRPDGWYEPMSEPPIGEVWLEWRQSGIDGPTNTAYRLSISATIVTTQPSQTEVVLIVEKFDPR